MASRLSTAAAARPDPAGQPQPRLVPRRRPPLRLVPPPESRARHNARRRARATTTVLAALSLTVVFGILGLRVLLAQGQVRVDRLEAQVEGAQSENQTLRLEVARLESPQRIVDEARRRLGMVPPENVTYLAPVPVPDAPGTPPRTP